MRTYEPDEWTLSMALTRAMENDGLTYDEVEDILFLIVGLPAEEETANKE